MKLSMNLSPFDEYQCQLASQIGVEAVVLFLLDEGKKNPELLTYQGLKKVQDSLKKWNLDISVIEGDPFDMHGIKVGLDTRDSEIARYIEMIKIYSDLGINTICYNFMAGTNWFRSKTSVKLRGDALSCGFVLDDIKDLKIDLFGKELTRKTVQDNHRYFLDKVLPVAESYNVNLALHPDDPPMPYFANVPRIASSIEDYYTVFDEYTSPNMGATFCQSNFKLMPGDLKEKALRLAKDKRIHFIHFRDIEGNVENFHETFHDNGPTDMVDMMNIYLEHCESDVPIRPDHVPSLVGEDNSEKFGYNMGGRIFAIGYMRALMQSYNYYNTGATL